MELEIILCDASLSIFSHYKNVKKEKVKNYIYITNYIKYHNTCEIIIIHDNLNMMNILINAIVNNIFTYTDCSYWELYMIYQYLSPVTPLTYLFELCGTPIYYHITEDADMHKYIDELEALTHITGISFMNFRYGDTKKYELKSLVYDKYLKDTLDKYNLNKNDIKKRILEIALEKELFEYVENTLNKYDKSILNDYVAKYIINKNKLDKAIDEAPYLIFMTCKLTEEKLGQLIPNIMKTTDDDIENIKYTLIATGFIEEDVLKKIMQLAFAREMYEYLENTLSQYNKQELHNYLATIDSEKIDKIIEKAPKLMISYRKLPKEKLDKLVMNFLIDTNDVKYILREINDGFSYILHYMKSEYVIDKRHLIHNFETLQFTEILNLSDKIADLLIDTIFTNEKIMDKSIEYIVRHVFNRLYDRYYRIFVDNVLKHSVLLSMNILNILANCEPKYALKLFIKYIKNPLYNTCDFRSTFIGLIPPTNINEIECEIDKYSASLILSMYERYGKYNYVYYIILNTPKIHIRCSKDIMELNDTDMLLEYILKTNTFFKNIPASSLKQEVYYFNIAKCYSYEIYSHLNFISTNKIELVSNSQIRLLDTEIEQKKNYNLSDINSLKVIDNRLYIDNIGYINSQIENACIYLKFIFPNVILYLVSDNVTDEIIIYNKGYFYRYDVASYLLPIMFKESLIINILNNI